MLLNPSNIPCKNSNQTKTCPKLDNLGRGSAQGNVVPKAPPWRAGASQWLGERTLISAVLRALLSGLSELQQYLPPLFVEAAVIQLSGLPEPKSKPKPQT